MGKDTEDRVHRSWVEPGQDLFGARTSTGVFAVPVFELRLLSPGSLHLLNAAWGSWHSDLLPQLWDHPTCPAER